MLSILANFFPPDQIFYWANHVENAFSGWDISIAIATVISALAMVVAALCSLYSAKSSERAVLEMQHSRLQSVRPILYHTAYTERMDIFWNPANKLSPPIDAAVMTKSGESYSSLMFQLGNHGQAPALNIRSHWEMAFDAEEVAKNLTCLKNIPGGVTIEVQNQEINFLQSMPKVGMPTRAAKPCAKQAEERYGACGPQSVMTRPFPHQIQSSLFIFGLQIAELGLVVQPSAGTKLFGFVMPVTMTLTYDTALEKDIKQVFSFTLNLITSQFVSSDSSHGAPASPARWDEVRMVGLLEASV